MNKFVTLNYLSDNDIGKGTIDMLINVFLDLEQSSNVIKNHQTITKKTYK